MKSLQNYEKKLKEYARLVNAKDYVATLTEYITETSTFDEIALYAGLMGELEKTYSIHKDPRYNKEYANVLQNIALGFARSQVGVIPMQIVRCFFLFEYFQVECNHQELKELEQKILDDLEKYNPETLEYSPFAEANAKAEDFADADAEADADADATESSRLELDQINNFKLSARSQSRYFYTQIQLYYTRVLMGADNHNNTHELITNIAKVYTPKVLSPSEYSQTLGLIFGEILNSNYHLYLDILENAYLKDDAPPTASALIVDTDSQAPTVSFWDHAPEVQTSVMLWSFHVLLDHCGQNSSVIPRLYDIVNTLQASLISTHSSSVHHLNAALLISYYHRLASDQMAFIGNAPSASNAEDILQSYIIKHMEPLDTPRNNSAERLLRIGIMAYSLPNSEYSSLIFKLATHIKLFDEDFTLYLYNEQSFRSSSDKGIEQIFLTLLGDDNYYSHPHPLYSTFAESAEGLRSRIAADNLDILIFTHMEYTDSFVVNLKSAPCQVYLSLFDKIYSSPNINATIAVSDAYRQVNLDNTVMETFTVETPLTMTPTTTPDDQLLRLFRGLY